MNSMHICPSRGIALTIHSSHFETIRKVTSADTHTQTLTHTHTHTHNTKDVAYYIMMLTGNKWGLTHGLQKKNGKKGGLTDGDPKGECCYYIGDSKNGRVAQRWLQKRPKLTYKWRLPRMWALRRALVKINKKRLTYGNRKGEACCFIGEFQKYDRCAE